VNCLKTAEPTEMPFWLRTSVGPRKHVLDGGAHWRNLSNSIEPSMCCGDAAFSSNYFEHLFYKHIKMVDDIADCDVCPSRRQDIYSSYRPTGSYATITIIRVLQKLLLSSLYAS